MADRKVRGERVRASQSEKRERSLSPAETPTDRTDAAPATDVGTLSAVGDAATDSFVETDAVADYRERVERWLSVGHPVHLIGPTGCGKTSLAMHVASERDRPVVFVNGDASLETSDLVGEHGGEERVSVRDKYVHNVHKSKDVVRDRWVDNPLTVAAREGATLVYNEFSRTKPAANNVLLSVFEEGVLELPGQRGADRYVEVHPEFRAILTSNSQEYAGVHEPQDALLDRLVGVHMDFYDADTERAIVRDAVDVDDDLLGAVVTTLRDLRAVPEIDVGTRSMIMAAEGLSPLADPDADDLAAVLRDVLASKVPDAAGVDRLETEIGEVLAANDLP